MRDAPAPEPDLEILDRDTCLSLLSGIEVGRLAWAEGERVLVFPLNFVLAGDNLVFRTSSAEICRAAQADHPTFQADDVEPAVHVGWTVMVRGPLTEVTDPTELERLRHLVVPWRPDRGLRALRLQAGEVTGRRLPLRAGAVKSVWIEA